ncbi:MAG: amino acid adenylation domain-containing protein [Acidobacteria bacterium]|nr:amino acid adenylation domain-containing protein [Acidobacteriota bacterium]
MNPDSANLSEAKRSLLQKYLRGEISQKIAGPSIIPRRPPRTPVPLSLAQQQVWLHSQLISPETPVYNEPMTLWRKGPLNVEALERSLAEIIRRHESWRTTIGMTDGKPVQVIHPAVSSYKVPYVDLRSLPDGQREAEAVRIATAEARKPFDVQQGPLVRATLVTVNDSDHRLYMTLHQIIMDGVSSYRVFLPEIISIYEAYSQGKSSPLPELPIQFGDFAVWQRDWVREDRIAKQMDYWRTQLTGNSAGVFTDHTRPTIQTHRGAMHPLHLGGELTRGLRRFSQQEGATLFMTLLAGFAGVLGRYSGLDEIVLGTPTASRKRPELESLLGYFVNPVALRISLAGDPTFRDLLGRVKDTVSEALFNDEVPFAYLVEQLRPAPDPSRNPFFQIAISLEPPPTAGEPEWSLSLADVSTGATKLDMYLLMDEKLEGITGPFTYNADLYEPETIARIVGHWQTLLEDALEHPDRRLSDLKLLTPAEERQILVEWNETHVSFPESNSISQLFEAQAARTPKSAAVIDGKSRLTFSELNERANQLAHYLNSKGVGPETLVSLCLERSASAIVGLLGILKAGGAYVPLDPAYPRERLQFMLDDSGATFLLTDSRMMGRIGKGAATTIQLDADSKAIEKESKENPPGSVSAENLAYVIYTSGSTGQPKGVQATHGASLNRFHWMWSKFPFQQDDVCCQKTSLSFVDSVWELFGPLLQGVPTVILSDEQVKDPRAFTEALAQNRVTRIVLVPSLLRLLLDAFSNLGTRLPDLKLCVSSGEALPADLARRFQKSAPQCKLVNLYGSSEVAADASCFECSCVPSLPTVPIGRPITNSQIYILDRNQKAVPIGVPGELYVGGAGLARGYLNRPELTAEKFVANPFVNTGTARLYKTGDLARFRSDGNIEHLGRLDSQVKVRGHRIELGEVEATLAQCPDVSACAVAARDDKQGDTQLVAYAVVSGKPMTAGEIRRYLRQRLPDTMVPSHIVFVEALPLLPNGKVDRRALPAPEPSADVRQDLFVAPRNTVESKLVAQDQAHHADAPGCADG